MNQSSSRPALPSLTALRALATTLRTMLAAVKSELGPVATVAIGIGALEWIRWVQ